MPTHARPASFANHISTNIDTLRVCPENIPPELAERGQWVGWRYRPRPGSKPAKVPVCPATGRAASAADPESWGDFGRCLDAYRGVPLDGVGYVFAEDDPF